MSLTSVNDGKVLNLPQESCGKRRIMHSDIVSRSIALSFMMAMIIVIVFLKSESVMGMNEKISSTFHHPMNTIEWSGVVFISQNLTIPFNTVLTIRDESTIVFYIDREEYINEKLIITFDKGDLKIGSNVKFLSLNTYNGETKPPSQVAINTDDWGFYFRYYLHMLNTPNTLNLNGVKVLKSRKRNEGIATFSMEGPTPISILRNCHFEGGHIAFRQHEDLGHGQVSVFGADNCTFRGMESVIENPHGGPTCFTDISNSLLEDMGIAVNYRGGSLSQIVKGVEFFSNTIRNVIQGVYSSVSAIVVDCNFQNFRVGVLSPVMTISNSTFDNSESPTTGIALLNTVQKKVQIEVMDSRFTNVMGSVLASDKIVSSLSFSNNIIEKCRGTPDFRFSLIHMSQTVFKLSFGNNTIVDNMATDRQFNIIHFGALNETVSFTENVLKNNKAKCILSIGDSLLRNPNWTIKKNVFDNVLTSSTKYAEVCYGGAVESEMKFNVELNYWGSDVDKSKNLEPWTTFSRISEKLYPVSVFSFVPYFRTANVNNDNSSNIGTWIPPVLNSTPSQNVASSSQSEDKQEEDEDEEIINAPKKSRETKRPTKKRKTSITDFFELKKKAEEVVVSDAEEEEENPKSKSRPVRSTRSKKKEESEDEESEEEEIIELSDSEASEPEEADDGDEFIPSDEED